MSRPRSLTAAAVGVAVLASVIAAAPASATSQPEPEVTAAATAPKVTVTPKKITTRHFDEKGVTVRLSGYSTGESVGLGWASEESGNDGVFGAVLTNSDGRATATYEPADADTVSGRHVIIAVKVVDGEPTGTIVKEFVVKAGTKVTWKSATRADGTVTLKAVAKKWSTKSDKYVAYKNVVVKFQQKVASGWKTVKTDEANADGVAVVKLAKGRDSWRAVVSTTAKVWGDASPAKQK